MSVFVDSWGWLGLFDETDSDHEPAFGAISKAIRERTELITTDYVLCETITLICRRLKGVAAIRTLHRMLDVQRDVSVQIEHIYLTRFSKALDLRFVYGDKLRISFTDLTTMVVMEELGISDIITRDSDFLSVNRGLRLLPEI
jgi:predicted nucleic acid-binding protein